MNHKPLNTESLFTAIDNRDWKTFGTFLTADVTFRYGSQPAVTGRDNVLTAAEQAVAIFTSLEHRIEQLFQDGDSVFVSGTVRYGLPHGRVVEVPFLNHFMMKADLIEKYLIYIDPSPVFAALSPS
jgi:hypothetical protein